MKSYFEITHDREFLQHFLTVWRTKSISAEMVELLKENSGSDPYGSDSIKTCICSLARPSPRIALDFTWESDSELPHRRLAHQLRLLLRLTMTTPAKTSTAESIFCQLRLSIPMHILMAVAMMGCTYAYMLTRVGRSCFCP